jgi:predicted AAA+ superfamily ATPase
VSREFNVKRYLLKEIQSLALKRHKMAFVSGPRQVGKTTMAKQLQKSFDDYQYLNWDESEFRKIWAKAPNRIKEKFSFEKINQSRLLILDEIHKSANWKQKLKGLFDELNEDLSIVVTGSARLNIFKKGGDSLLGRYFLFRLHPFSYGELLGHDIVSPDVYKTNLFEKKTPVKLDRPIIERLFKYSGFPEPYLAESDKILNIWRKGRNEKIVREDLRDISRLPELSQIEMLASLLPEKVGNPLSVQSLREDLEVAHDTVSRWLKYLNELYYFFELKPWTKMVARSIKKEGKIYLYDWTNIEKEGERFENLIASHLLKACHYWTDTGEGDFNLHYLRNKEKQEIDFLIVKNKKPWLMVECKWADTNIESKTINKFQNYFSCPYVQVVYTPNIWRLENQDPANQQLVCSIDRLLCQLP